MRALTFIRHFLRLNNNKSLHMYKVNSWVYMCVSMYQDIPMVTGGILFAHLDKVSHGRLLFD